MLNRYYIILLIISCIILLNKYYIISIYPLFQQINARYVLKNICIPFLSSSILLWYCTVRSIPIIILLWYCTDIFQLVHRKRNIQFVWMFCIRAWKTAPIRRVAVRETGVSRYHGGPIEGPPETPRTPQHYRIKGIKGVEEMEIDK